MNSEGAQHSLRSCVTKIVDGTNTPFLLSSQHKSYLVTVFNADAWVARADKGTVVRPSDDPLDHDSFFPQGIIKYPFLTGGQDVIVRTEGANASVTFEPHVTS